MGYHTYNKVGCDPELGLPHYADTLFTFHPVSLFVYYEVVSTAVYVCSTHTVHTIKISADGQIESESPFFYKSLMLETDNLTKNKG